MEIIYQTRFSFYGKSGWRSPASKNPELLFQRDRLEERFALFEAVTLASLACQSDRKFRHFVLSSDLMPDWAQKRLRQMCNDILGPKRVAILFAPKGSASRHFRRYTRRHFSAQRLAAQVVLDDDDGLCQDFTALLRREAQHAWDNNLDSTEAVFLSFADGVSLVFRDTGPPHLAARHVPFTNLGLAMVARPGSLRHPLATSHLRIGARHHARVITSHRPTYIRSVHDHNDSRAQHSDARLEDPAFESSLAAFPFLTDLLRPKGAQTPLAPHASPA